MKTLQSLLDSVPMADRLAHRGPWWELLSAEDQAALAEICRGLFRG